MSIFSKRYTNTTKHINGPDIHDVKVTIENLCSHLTEEVYDEGIDAVTMCNTIIDLYSWLSGVSRKTTISLPAPSTNPDDRYRSMWPEGARVRTRSRRDSMTSSTSHASRTSNVPSAPPIDRTYTNSRASTTTSSRYAPVRTKFLDDEPAEGFKDINVAEVRRNYGMKNWDLKQQQNRRRSLSSTVTPHKADTEGRGVKWHSTIEHCGDDEIEQIDTRSVNKLPLRTNKDAGNDFIKRAATVFLDD